MSRTDGRLRTLWRKHLPEWDWLSVEVGGSQTGVPDMNACLNGREIWIENKLASAKKVGLSIEQAAWITRRTRAGGRIFIAVRRISPAGPRRPLPADELHLFTGRQAYEVLDHGLETPALARFAGGPARWDWARISNLLLTH